MTPTNSADIAVVALSGRFPKARDVDEFWANLRAGVDATSTFSRDEMAADGVPDELLDDPSYVGVRGFLDGAEDFDAGVFGYTPGQAELLDPQQRLLLESACDALEVAAHGAADGSRVGVFVGTTLSKYLLAMLGSPRLRARIDPLTMVAAERDCAATRIAYKLNLTGPALTVQSACSTSLVAVHLAVSALRNGDCDTALAGGASVSVPRRAGYRHEAGGAFSADGSSRPFDHRATGTVPGDGVGVVVLRRLADAVAAGDRILAVVKGTAVNNDGAAKVGYTAPSVDGQVAVIRAAHRNAGVAPASISYVEAHGTATPVGDPIEVAALTEAFGDVPAGRCLIGSVKSNLGHLDSAAGITGFIKTVLQLHHRELVPSLHFEAPNPLLELDRTPFRVSTELSDWPQPPDSPRRATVSAFGVGGTNAHVVLEEYQDPGRPARVVDEPGPERLVVLSAASPDACRAMREQWADALTVPSPADPADLAEIADSAATGRPARRYRWFTATRSRKDLVEALRADDRSAVRAASPAPRTTFVFPGAGGQYRGMAATLARTEPVFAEALQRCVAAAGTHGVQLGPLLARPDSANRLTEPREAVPALFAVEYALAQLLTAWGVRPEALVGHSTGEYVAACVAGVFGVEDAVRLLILRADLATSGADGAMLQVNLPEQDCAGLLDEHVALAAVNAPDICVLSGARAQVTALADRLTADGVENRLVPVRGAGHSALLDPVLPQFRDALLATELHPPGLPVVSSVTGDWLTTEQAVDPDYWVRQFRHTVRFVDALHTVLEQPSTLWVMGPGRAYLGWSRRVAATGTGHVLLSCLPEAEAPDTDRRELLTALGRHWAAGGEVRWAAVQGDRAGRRRVALPGYPFQRVRYWALDRRDASGAAVGAGTPGADAVADPAAGAEPAGYDRPGLASDYQAPRTPREELLAGLWSTFFGIARIGVHDDFFELGGDSLLAVRLGTAIRGRTGAALLPGTLLRARTIAALAEAMEEGSEPDAAATGAEPAPPDLVAARQAALHRVDALLADVPPAPARTGTDRLVVVGGTGHLSPYLLAELLAQQELPITVLVRGADADAARRRLRDLLTERSLWSPAAAERLTVLAADLRTPGFGLSGVDWSGLVAEAVAVYHCAAEVNFVRPYDQMEPANVRGAETAIRLVAESGRAHLHFLSTLGVLRQENPTLDPYRELPLSAEPGALPNGYLQSKWVAEHAVRRAHEAGLPVSVYRICAVAGDSLTGYCNHQDLFWRIIGTALATGLAPQRDAEIVSTPVDAAGRALAAGSLRTVEDAGVIAHLAPEPVTWTRIWAWVRECGHAVEEIPAAEWRAELTRRVRAGADLPLTPVISALETLMPDEPRRFATDTMASLLEGTGIGVPALDPDNLAVSVDHLLSLPSYRNGDRPPVAEERNNDE